MKQIYKVLIVVFLIIIYIVFWGMEKLKESFKENEEKSRTEGQSTEKSSYVSPDYYELNPVWDSEKDVDYQYHVGPSNEDTSVQVSGTAGCKLYTYENNYFVDRTTKDGSLNTLLNNRLLTPNLFTVFDDFVNGACHDSGKTDNNPTCIDPDQLYVKRVSRKCIDKKQYNNKCLSSQGFVVNEGQEEQYNKKCADTPCDGQVGCLSFNFFSNGTTMSKNTKCLSINKITVGTGTDQIYDLDFYRRTGIIDESKDVNNNGPFPIDFGFDVCNNFDPKQKLKIVRYNYKLEKGEDGQPVKNAKVSKNGSYGSIIFRGLNSYLDLNKAEGKFVLKPLTGKVEDSIKWIFMPEIEMTRKTIPSAQRCLLIRSNVEGRDDDGFPIENSPGGGLGLGLLGRKTLSLAGKKMSTINWTAKEGGRAGAKLGVGKTAKALVGKGLSKTGKFLTSGLKIFSKINTVLVVFSILQIIADIIPVISYESPISYAASCPAGFRVQPSDFEGEEIADVPGVLGSGNASLLEELCTVRELPNYPEYFLISQTQGGYIEPQYIKYKTQRQTSVTFKNITFQTTYGYNMWVDPAGGNNLNVDTSQDTWQDGSVTWKIYKGKDRFFEAIAYNDNYFVGDNTSIETANLETGTVRNGGYITSKKNTVVLVDYVFNQVEENKRRERDENSQEKVEGSVYENVPTENTQGGEYCTLDILVGVKATSTTTSVRFIEGFRINNRGQGYAVDTVLTILGSEIGDFGNIQFTIKEVAEQEFLFKSLTKTSNGFYIEGREPLNAKIISSGYQFSSTYNSGDPTTFTSKIKLAGGFGYKKEDEVPMAQYDILTGELLYPEDTTGDQDKTLFINFEVETIQQLTYSYGSMSPEKLFPEKDTDLQLNYNFMDNSDNNYSTSPQQIVYGGELDSTDKSLIDNLSDLIEGKLTGEKVYDFIINSPRGDTGVIQTGENSLYNLKSLQMKSQKYTTTERFQPVTNDNDTLILGRFIPYREFSPAYQRVKGWADVLEGGTHDETDSPDGLYYGVCYTYYNWNYAQIIPYGVLNVYNNLKFGRSPGKF